MPTGEAAKPNLPKQPVRTYLVDDDIEVQEQREKSPSPSKNLVSQYIYIENLVRPYTINQLKLVMRRTGNICEGGFWINNIKSRCYVKVGHKNIFLISILQLFILTRARAHTHCLCVEAHAYAYNHTNWHNLHNYVHTIFIKIYIYIYIYNHSCAHIV